MVKIRLAYTVDMPDLLQLSRYQHAPELGPRILFFSGGSALRGLCGELARYTHNTVHLITPFDSGGSSATLRRAFGMPAVGDLRNRLMALADRSLLGHPEIYDLFAYRFPKDQPVQALRERLTRMAEGADALVALVPEPLAGVICGHLRYFLEQMPDDFDLRGASVGNLILTGGYLHGGRRLEPVIKLFSKLVKARGVVRPTLDADLHLAAELADGRWIVGQHAITGKETPPLDAAVRRLCLVRGLDDPRPPAPACCAIEQTVLDLIASAELICYPIGSFYTSLIANLLPEGVAEAIRRNPCPKVFVPNTSGDPEQFGMTLGRSVSVLLDALLAGGATEPPPRIEDALDFILLDPGREIYPPEGDFLSALRGVRLLEQDLRDERAPLELNPRKLAACLLSLV
jgi:CofD-related protein of GAK system